MTSNKFSSLLLLLFTTTSVTAQLYSIEYDYSKICDRVPSQLAIEYNMAQKNVSDILASLNLSSYNIDVIECDKLNGPAVAYLNPNDGNKYILINKTKLTELNTKYFAHLFVIAHEFAHHKLDHFGNSHANTNASKRQCEIDADRYAASIVKSLKGELSDCLLALDLLKHPLSDEYEDHPTKDKRIEAVKDGFRKSAVIEETKSSPYTDFLSDFKDLSLLNYSSGFKPQDIEYYTSETQMSPRAIFQLNGEYWIYWQRSSSVISSVVYWSYSSYPADKIRQYRNDGYNYKFLEKIDGKWFIVLLKYNTQFDQLVKTINKSDFIDAAEIYRTKIGSNLDDGYSIQNLIEYDNENYLILLTRTPDEGGYSWVFSDTFAEFEDWHRKMGPKYNYLYCYKQVHGRYFGYIKNHPTISTWKIIPFGGKEDVNELTTNLNDGFSIDNITGQQDLMRFVLRK